MLDRFQRLRQEALNRFYRYGEPALAIGSSAIAEPVSGLAGIGSLLSGKSASDAALAIAQAQAAMTYKPRTAQGMQGLQGFQQVLQPIGDVIQGASQNLGDKAYSATGSPLAGAIGYSLPTAMLEGLGLKGLNIARKPVNAADLYSARMVGGPITSVHQLFDLTPEDLATQLRTSDPSKLTESGAWRQQSGRFYTDYMPDGSTVMFMNDGRMLKQMPPDEAKRLFRERILEVETSKPEAQQIIEQRNQTIEQPKSENDYRMQHKAPTRSGGNPVAADLSSVFDDIYGPNALKYNSHGAPYDKKAVSIIQSLRGNPNKEVEVFRAVPKGVNNINDGDWVTTTKEYARDHIGDSKDYHIISKKVKASEIASDGNSIHEFGYEPIK